VVLRENEIEIPSGFQPRMIADNTSISFQFEPQKSEKGRTELTESALSEVAGGTGKAAVKDATKNPTTEQYLTYTYTAVYVT
jgi:hypothetical protein